MIFLYVLLGILLFLLLLTLIPVQIEAEYSEKIVLILKIGFVNIKLLPPQPKKAKKKKPKKNTSKKSTEKKESEKENTFAKLFKQEGLSGIVNILSNVAKIAKGVLMDVFRHIVITELYLNISLSEKNAADTAINYGVCCSAVYPAIGVICDVATCKDCQVNITPVFDESGKVEINFHTKLHIRIFWLVKLVITNGIKALVLLFKFRRAKKQENKDKN